MLNRPFNTKRSTTENKVVFNKTETQPHLERSAFTKWNIRIMAKQLFFFSELCVWLTVTGRSWPISSIRHTFASHPGNQKYWEKLLFFKYTTSSEGYIEYKTGSPTPDGFDQIQLTWNESKWFWLFVAGHSLDDVNNTCTSDGKTEGAAPEPETWPFCWDVPYWDL